MSNANELAYPILETEIGINLHHGLTKREHFAAMAMQAMISSKYYGEFKDKGGVSYLATKHADELLNELDKECK